jgi:hypothetical protein
MRWGELEVGMLIIANSDILYTNGFVHERLHQEWNRFADGCRSVDAELVIPRTALYEIELRQQELYEKEVDSIATACGLLRRYGVDLAMREPTDLIKMPDIVDLFCKAGVKARIEETLWTTSGTRSGERQCIFPQLLLGELPVGSKTPIIRTKCETL